MSLQKLRIVVGFQSDTQPTSCVEPFGEVGGKSPVYNALADFLSKTDKFGDVVDG